MKNLSITEIINHPLTSKYLAQLGIKGNLTIHNYKKIDDKDWKKLITNLQMEKYSYSMNEALFFAKEVLRIDNIEIIDEISGMFQFRLVDKIVQVWNSNHGENFNLEIDSANIGFQGQGSYQKDFIEVERFITELKG